jgi:hypothetical protein
MTTNKLIDLGKVSEKTKGLYLGTEGPHSPFVGPHG